MHGPLLRADVYIGPHHVVLEDALQDRLASRVDSLLEAFPTPRGAVAYITNGVGVSTLFYQAGAWVLFD